MQEKKSDAAPWNVCSVHKNPMTFLFLNVDIENVYIQKRKGTGCIMRQTTRRKIGRLEDWKILLGG
jgi:hypothetical protein